MKILVADDDSSIRKAIEYDFKEKNIEALFAQDGKQAQDLFDEFEPSITVLDIKMPKLDGMELLKYIKKKAPETKVLMISAHGTIELAVEAMKIGAEDFIVKPFSLAELSDKILRLKDIEPDILKNRNDFLGQSKAFTEHKKMLQRLAKVDSTVLLTGESGTGKEMAAKYIHENSRRKERPFIAVNCSILSKELLSSELFGHKKGSFTGAVDNRKGKFSEAHTGTIFLDEVGEIDTEIQARLLRVIQEGEIEIVGESKPVKVDVRIIAATNRDLLEDVDNGRFREDLYYRLNVVEVKVPPLRERKDDIKLLTEEFIKELSIRTGSQAIRINPKAIQKLEQNIWSGNIRQLKNSIERAMIFCDTEELTEKDFDFLQKQPENKRLSSEISSDNELDVFEKNEKKHNNRTYEKCQKQDRTCKTSRNKKNNSALQTQKIRDRVLMKGKYILRLDDFCHTSDIKKWNKVEEILQKYNIIPIVAVIPENIDKALFYSEFNNFFWDKVKYLKNKGWIIAQHGYQHFYETKKSGLLKINNYSEFAGLSYNTQIDKIRKGYNSFVREGIFPEVFIAPAHSFDKNTLKALKDINTIRVISDGFHLFPYKKNGLIFVPQQIWKFRKMPLGIWTICIHPDTLSKKELQNIENFLKKHSKDFVGIDNFYITKRKKSIIDITFEYLYKIIRNLKEKL